ncbi:hypothetical protein FGO68_gene4453 [Halteria grandinella]|uniref:NADP-dependent oxidoreductase domain-containing protein n=1 Tax=Halteria grandinella TaxID=5974 RepID=A0A8J8NL95_HALGN|nr:hypothetical protein FGO68_gene4453 [Halteria grandinella]
MEAESTYYQLSNGKKMPKIGLGTYRMDQMEPILKGITEAGFRHIDTAARYDNEELVGEAISKAIKSGKVKREDLFIATKLWHTDYGNPEKALRESLSKLNLDYVDLYMIHWPAMFFSDTKIPLHKLWPALESLVDKGLVKSLGISNFNVQLLSDLLLYALHKPVCNQIELHPYCSQSELLKFMKDQGIVPVAYCPLGRPTSEEAENISDVKKDNRIKEIAEKHGKSVYQVILRWGIERGCGVIPKSTNVDHQKLDLEVLDFKLDPDEIGYLSSLEPQEQRICCKLKDFNEYDLFA